jgi:hypothetical protein
LAALANLIVRSVKFLVKEGKPRFISQIHNTLIKQGTSNREAEEEKGNNETCTPKAIPIHRLNSCLLIGMGHGLRRRKKRF